MRTFFALLFFCVQLSVIKAQPLVWKSFPSPQGGIVEYVVDDNVVYCQMESGRFVYSEDKGKTWTITNKPSARLAGSYAYGDNVFAIVDSDSLPFTSYLRKSSNRGKNWEFLRTLYGYGRAIIGSGDTMLVYVYTPTGTNSFRYSSLDGGEHWDSLACEGLYPYQRDPFFFKNKVYQAVCVVSSDLGITWHSMMQGQDTLHYELLGAVQGAVIATQKLLGDSLIGVYSNYKGDNLWQPIAYLPMDTSLKSINSSTILFAHCANSSVILECLDYNYRTNSTTQRFYYSNDSGTALHRLALPSVVHGVAHVYPLSSQTILCSDKIGIYQTTNAGAKWEKIHDTLLNNRMTGKLAIDRSIIYYAPRQAFYDMPIVVSNDEGQTWDIVPFQTYIEPGTRTAFMAKGDTIISSQTYDMGYSEGGLYFSANKGKDWKHTKIGHWEENSYIDIHDTALMVEASGSIYTWNNNTWTKRTTPYRARNMVADNNYYYIVTYGIAMTHIVRTKDIEYPGDTLFTVPSEQRVIAMAASGSCLYVGLLDKGILRFCNGSATPVFSSFRSDADTMVPQLLHARRNMVVAVGQSRIANGKTYFWISRDYGETWKEETFFADMAVGGVVPTDSALYVGTQYGLYRADLPAGVLEVQTPATEEKGVHLNPQPAHDDICVTWNTGNDVQEIILYDMLGRQIQTLSIKPGTTRIHMSVATLQPGLYTLAIRTAQAFLTQCFVVVR